MVHPCIQHPTPFYRLYVRSVHIVDGMVFSVSAHGPEPAACLEYISTTFVFGSEQSFLTQMGFANPNPATAILWFFSVTASVGGFLNLYALMPDVEQKGHFSPLVL